MTTAHAEAVAMAVLTARFTTMSLLALRLRLVKGPAINGSTSVPLWLS